MTKREAKKVKRDSLVIAPKFGIYEPVKVVGIRFVDKAYPNAPMPQFQVEGHDDWMTCRGFQFATV